MNTVLHKVVIKFTELNIQNSNLTLVPISPNNLHSNKNLVRMGGENQTCIDELAKLIKNNKYDVNNYIPPIVEPNDGMDGYTIISGHHRYKAHKVANQKEMVCVVANFSSDSDRAVWRVLENSKHNENYVKNVFEDKDYLNIILGLMKDPDNGIKPDRRSVGKFIDRAKITQNNITKTKLINGVMEKIGVIDTDYIRTLKNEEIQPYIDKLSSSVTDVNVILSTFGPDKNDYFARTFNKSTLHFIKNPTKKICIPYSISGATNSAKLIECREKVCIEFEKMLGTARQIVKLENDGHDFMSQIDFVPLPQLGNEIKKEKDGGLEKTFNDIEHKYTKKVSKKDSLNHIDIDTIALFCKKMESDPSLKEKFNQLLNEND